VAQRICPLQLFCGCQWNFTWHKASVLYSHFVGAGEILLRWIVSWAHFYKLFDFTKVCIRQLIGTCQRRINRLHLFTQRNAHNFNKIINHPCTWTVLQVSAIYHHPQGDIIRRRMKPTYPIDYVGFICLLDMLVACALVLYLPEDGDISPKHVGQSMYGWFMILYKLCAFVVVCGWL